jgi:hypothetical protein
MGCSHRGIGAAAPIEQGRKIHDHMKIGYNRSSKYNPAGKSRPGGKGQEFVSQPQSAGIIG